MLHVQVVTSLRLLQAGFMSLGPYKMYFDLHVVFDFCS